MNKTKRLLLTGLLAAAFPALAAEKPSLEKIDVSKLPPAAKASDLTFSKDIQPMLQKSCVRCHGDERPKANLRLTNLESLLKGSKDGKVVVPGDSKKSWLVIAASQIDEETAMPPKHRPGGPGGHGPGGPGGPPPGGPGGPPPGGPGGFAGRGGPGGRGGFGPPPPPLTAEQVGVIRAWVDQGAK